MLAKRISRFFTRKLSILLDERCAANERYYRRGGFKAWPDAIVEMKNGDYSGVSMLREDWFVVLDDVASEQSKGDFATSKLFEILNARIGLFTVITANLTFEEISRRMDGRIASRLLRNGSVVHELTCEDYNIR